MLCVGKDHLFTSYLLLYKKPYPWKQESSYTSWAYLVYKMLLLIEL